VQSSWREYEGQILEGKYYLQRLLGVGSYGSVYLAHEVVADRLIRQVAVKLIATDSQSQEAQLQEMIAATNLDHPALLRCYTPGLCQVAGQEMLYLVTELAEETLEDRLSQGPLSEAEAREVVFWIGSALRYLHEQPRPLVHRDLKPANVFRHGGGWKLGDFGLLYVADDRPAGDESAALGTAAYAAPESYAGVVSPAWDAWSLGVLLVEALTGRLPFAGETAHQLMIRVSSQEPSLPPDLPEPLNQIALGCLIKDPRARWTMRQVLEALTPTPESGISEPASAGSGGLASGFYERFAAVTPQQTSPAVRSVVVSASGQGDYRTLGEALKSAPPETRILVRPGVYAETLLLDHPADITGDGPVAEIVVEAAGAPCLMMRCDRAAVRHLTLRSRPGPRASKYPAISIPQGQLLLEDCDVQGAAQLCIEVQGENTRPLLRRCRIHDGKSGGIVFSGRAGGLLEDCELFGNGGPGVSIRDAAGPELHRCRLYAGRQAGVAFSANGRGTLDSCDIYGNEGPGVDIADGSAPTLQGCRIYDGKQAGVSVRANATGRMEDCALYGHVLSGITITQGGNPTLQRCKIYDGQSNGVWVADGGQGTFEDCEIFNNAFAGVKVTQAGDPILRRTSIHAGKRTGITVHEKGRATVVDCDIFANAQAGILVEAGGEALLRRCLLHDGQETGVLFAGRGKMEACDVSGNARAGVEIVQGGSVRIRGGSLHSGLFPGLLVHQGGEAVAEDCDIYAHAMSGVAVGENGRLDIQRSRIYDNQQVGMVFWDHGRGVVEECEIHNNRLGGVIIRSCADPLLRACHIHANGGFGVRVDQHGEGAVLRCLLEANAEGPIYTEPGCSVQAAENHSSAS